MHESILEVYNVLFFELRQTTHIIFATQNLSQIYILASCVIFHVILYYNVYPLYSVSFCFQLLYIMYIVLWFQGIGVTLHEFFHAIGSWHEQSRTDRDDHIIINTDNIQNRRGHNFAKKTSSQMDLYGTEYSFRSIMHYGSKVSLYRLTNQQFTRKRLIGQSRVYK